ncbi:hypothetical protein NRA54_19260, partial [Acinetobacter baumannii]|nr:hypothetical protein [Acinetobacter baumannii]
YKSLKPFEIELPNFVILTGINGVGKTQVLQALIQGQLAKITVADQIIQFHQIKYIDKLLTPKDIHPIERHSFDEIEDFELHHQLFPAYSLLLNYLSEFGQFPESYEIYQQYNNERAGHQPVL